VSRSNTPSSTNCKAAIEVNVLETDENYSYDIDDTPMSVKLNNFIDEFVEDFKASAPIWKYDLKDGKRIYALDRSTAIKGSGILGEKS